MTWKWMSGGAAALAIAVTSGLASADTILIAGNNAASSESQGAYCGTVSYEDNGDGSGTLLVNLKNISAKSNGGFITGFLFNVNSTDPMAMVVFDGNADYPAFEFASGNGEPFGDDYDGGAALGGDFLGGGNPNGGIPVGAMTTFSFTVFAEDAGSLTAIDFLTGPYEYDFIVRFRGFENGQSDKVPARCPADFNGDGFIDGQDLGPILAYWGGPPGPFGAGDADCDGFVNVEDLREWLSKYGPCPF